MHICVSKPTLIGSDKCLLRDRRQAIIWTDALIVFIVPLGTAWKLIRNLFFLIEKNAFENAVW